MEVGAKEVGQHLCGFRRDAVAFGFQVILNPAWDVAVVQLLRLKPHALLVNLLGQGLALVELLVLIDENKERGLGNGIEISLKFLQVLHILRFLDDDHHAFAHHRKAAGVVGDGLHIHVATINHDLVKSAVGLVQGLVLDGVGNHVDEIGLIACQEIDGREVLLVDVGKNLVVGHHESYLSRI